MSCLCGTKAVRSRLRSSHDIYTHLSLSGRSLPRRENRISYFSYIYTTYMKNKRVCRSPGAFFSHREPPFPAQRLKLYPPHRQSSAVRTRDFTRLCVTHVKTKQKKKVLGDSSSHIFPSRAFYFKRAEQREALFLCVGEKVLMV